MKSMIFCTSYVSDARSWEKRYQRWLDHYDALPIDNIRTVMIDDGSIYLPESGPSLDVISNTDPIKKNSSRNLLIHFNDNLGRQSLTNYPGWWRSFMHSMEVADQLGVDKIIHIESDAYVLSGGLVDYINQTQRGWHALWSERHCIPESAIQIICRDQFAAFKRFRRDAEKLVRGRLAEVVLPFTTLNQSFKGDRYSEGSHQGWIQPVPKDADYATQVVAAQKIEYRPA